MYFLGIDLGTSGVKTVLFDTSGVITESSLCEYPLYQPDSGWAEQEPLDWWNNTKQSIRNVLDKSGVNAADIKGIGLSGQMHGLVMLDKKGIPLCRSIIWCDQRTVRECELITEKAGAQRLIEITANPALTGFTLSKILWIKANKPAVYKDCAHILLPKDYIRYMLTGEFATEVSDASGMQLMNISARKWSDEILSIFDIDQRLLGRLYESEDITGTVSAAAAEATGLKKGTPVAGGAGDQAAAAIGNGIVKEGLISCNIGSSGVIFAQCDTPQIERAGRVHTFCHAVRNKWHVMGVTQGAGLSMKWLKDRFFFDAKDEPYKIINEGISACGIGSGGIYLPYLMGERSPHLDPDARGVFFGLDNNTSREKMARAVMEGVSYSLLDCLRIIESMGKPGGEIRICGGGSNSAVWRQMIADVFNIPVVTANSSEAGALGVAILAAVAAGKYKDIISACDNMVSTGSRILPDKQNSAKYLRLYEVFKELYISLKPSFSVMKRINGELR